MPTQMNLRPAPTVTPDTALIQDMAHRLQAIDRVVRSISMSLSQWRRELIKIIEERPEIAKQFESNEQFQEFLKEQKGKQDAV